MTADRTWDERSEEDRGGKREDRSGLTAARPATAHTGSGGRGGAPARSTRPVARAHPAAAEKPRRLMRPLRRSRFVVSKLTARVLAINVLALMILVGGLLYLGRYEERLIETELEALETQAQIFAGALGESAVVGDPNLPQGIDPQLARQMVRRLYETTDTRTRLFGANGALIADSRLLGGPGGVVEIHTLPPLETPDWLTRQFDAVYDWLTGLTPRRRKAPPYEEWAEQRANDYDPVTAAMVGEQVRQMWSTPDGGLILAAAVPVQRLRVVHGALLVTVDNTRIELAIKQVREDILQIFAVALLVTVLLSSYLAGTITRPIRRLAAAAEQVRRGHGRQHEIPDFTNRHDEIGELSGALREMTAALWLRMDAIERFAADVAHEIKNPLSSLRSAVETTVKVKDPEQQRRLLSIIVEDVQRLNRLITDISDASRLDSELSRAEAEPVNVGAILRALAELYQTTREQDGPRITLTVADDGARAPLRVAGLESRLVQVLRNLITNAISFSPPGGAIALSAVRDAAWVKITVRDEGPGIPNGKLEAIFDRFYSERPAGEKFGTHSGLGLSISKQIVEAHRGQIYARNRADRSGAVFVVRIPAL